MFETGRGRGESEQEFYLKALDDAESGWQSTGYGAPINQRMRFDTFRDFVILQDDELKPYSLLDVGCGTGDLLSYLAQYGLMPETYVGIDTMAEMVDRAKAVTEKKVLDGELPASTQATFREAAADEYLALAPNWEFDYVTSIAAFALKSSDEAMTETLGPLYNAIDSMVAMAKKAVMITLFSTWKTAIIPEEMVFDPSVIFNWAKSNYERVDLLHGYAPFDFSLIIRTEASEWRKEYEANRA